MLGPSGIGKTTILRTIAGLQKLSGGKIKLRGRILASEEIHIEPEKRNVALSFQDNSLFPNYKVIDVIIIDHHISESICPNVFSIVNPNRYDDASDLTYLCASGVCFIFLIALLIIDETDNTDYFIYKFNISKKDQKRLKIINN